MVTGVDGMDYVGPSPSPSRKGSEGRLTASSSVNSFRSPSPDRPVWRRFVSRAGRFLQDMVDLDDDGSAAGVADAKTVDDLHEDCNQGYTGLNEDRGMLEGRQPLGDTRDPLPLHREDCLSGDEDVCFDREPSEASQLISVEEMVAVSSHMPLRHRHKKWILLYSTLRDGISMQTLLRKSKGQAPTVLLVRDMSKHIFGAFCSEAWRQSQRYFGTGETFVFRVEPRPVVWHWWWQKAAEQQNDFFMWGSQEAIAVGGAGGYAIWLDNELCRGLSRSSLTFGNTCLAAEEEFVVGAVELWALQ
jgi:hypothetical protein